MTSLTANDPGNVRLLPGPILQRQDRNHQYLLSLDVDRLLHNFRLNAGLPSDAKPLGGWEAPGHGLRGHFVGHYISACGHLFQATGDPRLLQRVDALIDGLAACQAALGNGYLAAIPESDLEQIETRFEGEWASYYVVHKIFAGLIDAFKLCRNEQALTMAQRLADHIRQRLEKLSPDQWRHMLLTTRPNPTNETGAWSESLLELFAITQNPEYQQLAKKFDCEWLLGPLARGEDPLTGLHANTHIPSLLGAARRHEITGEPALRRAVEHFWQRTAVARSFVNGGSSGPRPDGLEKSKGAEHWPEAFRLAMTLTPKINESCVTHNMLRLTDTLYRWTGDAIYADFFERGYFNHVLAMQNRSELGGYLYDHPLGSCSRKVFGHSHDAFWC
ncbi:MAG: beta-L-arabinofuranosidase domain-containing protein, partial [Tepidisphaeraceae bacterium]